MSMESSEGYYENTYDPWSDTNGNGIALSNELPWGGINIVVLTDVHSWIGGNHRDDPRQWPYDQHRESNQDATFGDVLSFYRRLQNLVDDHNRNQNSQNNKRDIFFVMNGDFVDGTGLSGNPPIHLAPLLHHMPWDAINVGNHELYLNETIRYVSSLAVNGSESYVQPNLRKWKGGSYLSSNTLLTDTRQPLTGSRYTYLEGSQTNTTILAFGFLYDFYEGGGASIPVPVRDVIQEEWFATVLGDDAPREFDAILVLAHMTCLDPLVRVILEGIRAALPKDKQHSMPIQFVTGHTHRRCHAKLDSNAESLEAGRWLDTIGFVSFDANGDGQDTKEKTIETSNHNFQHRFLDANLGFLHETLVLEHKLQPDVSHNYQNETTQDFDKDFGTNEGRALTSAIRNTEMTLGLNEVIGCSPTTYEFFQPILDPTEADTNTATLISPYDDPKSVMHLYLRKVIPSQLLESIVSDSNTGLQGNSGTSGEPIFLAGSGTLRYSLFEGQVTINNAIAVSPFGEMIHEIVSWKTTSEGEVQFLPIYGWELVEWLEAVINAVEGEYGLPPLLLSALPPTDASDNKVSSAPIVDPQKTYRLFATDFDSHAILSVTEKLSFSQGRLFRSQQAYRGSNSMTEDRYVHVELWKKFIREEMPCAEVPRIGTSSSIYSPQWGSAQTLQPPLSATSVRAQRRTRRAQQDITLANEQKVAMILVVVALAVIAYKIMARTVSRISPDPLLEHAVDKTDSGKRIDLRQRGFRGSYPL